MSIFVIVVMAVVYFAIMGIFNYYITKNQFLTKRLKGRELVQADDLDLALGLEEKKKKMTLKEKIELQIERSGLDMTLDNYYQFALISSLITFILVLMVMKSIILGIILMPFGLLVPKLYLNKRFKKRQKQFGEQLESNLMTMANSISGGMSVEQAVENLAKEAPNPSKDEFELVHRDVVIGLSLEEALQNMRLRLQNSDIDLVSTVIIIQRKTGGNLPKILKKIATTIRERVKLKQQLKAATSQGRTSGYIMAAIPGVIFVVLSLSSPGFFDPLLNSALGLIILVGIIGLDIIGLMVSLKIATPKLTVEDM